MCIRDRHGAIAIALVSGCDFAPHGMKHCGIDKALTCVKGILHHTRETAFQDFFLKVLSDGVPSDNKSVLTITGCNTCRKCGHGSVGKLKHGQHGCAECGTLRSTGGEGGCIQRTSSCPCDFHRRHDEIVLARTLSAMYLFLSPTIIRKVFAIFSEQQASENMRILHRRPDLALVTKFILNNCGSKQQDIITYMLPSILAWDVAHRDDPSTQFIADSICGECFAGLAPNEKITPSKASAVLHWAAAPGHDVPEALVQMANSLHRTKKSISKRWVAKCYTGLVEEYCSKQIEKMVSKTSRKVKSNDEIYDQMLSLCVDSWYLSPITGKNIASSIKRLAPELMTPNKKKKKKKSIIDFLCRD